MEEIQSLSNTFKVPVTQMDFLNFPFSYLVFKKQSEMFLTPFSEVTVFVAVSSRRKGIAHKQHAFSNENPFMLFASK